MPTNDSTTGGPLLPESPLVYDANGNPVLDQSGVQVSEHYPATEDVDFDAILQGLVAGITGLPVNLVRPRWTLPVVTQAPEANTNWCAIGQIEDDPGFNYFERHDGDTDAGLGSTTTQVQSVIRILASFYGPKARSYASALRNGIMVPQNREYLFPYGMALQQMPSGARYVPEIVNLQTRPRVDVEVLLRVPSVRVWPIRNIIAVPFTVEPDEGAGVSVTVTED